MNSIILQIAAKYIRGILLFFAVLALLRGHNNPGGGFIGGLLAALSIIYYGFAFNTEKIKERMIIKPNIYLAFGLLLVLLSFIPSIVNNITLMQGVWLKINLPLLGELKLGTPFIFDIGVFFTVIGVIFLFFISLTNKE